ncbi:MAG: endonuclease/exonuclease/phosphatase family protein [Acidimicrobiales bacterium]
MSSTLTFLTWNLAMLARSAQAPPWWTQEHSQLAVRERVLAAEPDLVLFQELPRLVPYVETHDMLRANPATHQGNLAVLVSNEVLTTEREVHADGPLVAVVEGCAVLATFTSGLTVANVHLAPGPAATAERFEQLARIVELSPTPDLLVVGDTNTRVDEIDTIAAAGLVGAPPPHPTWDSRRNRFNPSGPEFVAYFTRWLATERIIVDEVGVATDPVVHDGRRFHVSDHYPLTGRAHLDRGRAGAGDGQGADR